MRRALLLALVAFGAAGVAAPEASAHPLGNFTVNHMVVTRVSADRVDLRYILDQAEIPTFQQRGRPRAQLLADVRATVARGVALTVGGRRIPLRVRGPGSFSFRPGQGGLPTTRAEVLLRADVEARGAVVVRDATYDGRVGWRAIVVRPGAGTAVRSDVPAADPTRGLRVYPTDVLSSPADRPVARLRVTIGDGTVDAPTLTGGMTRTTSQRPAGDGFAGAFADAAAGRGVLLFLLLAAFGWGAVHALSPGHGKAMVAAYLVGTRGTSRDALALGATVTVTHTIGVFALGLVTLALSAYILPEQLYPWLNLVSGLLVVVVGLAVLRSRFRARRHARHDHDHHHHDHAHDHHDHGPSRRGLLAMGASAGLIPCPSALVVLLAAIAQAQVALGLVLIVAFSLGLAATLSALALAVVWTRRFAGRLAMPGPAHAVATALPSVSAAVIIVVGAVLTARAIPDLG